MKKKIHTASRKAFATIALTALAACSLTWPGRADITTGLEAYWSCNQTPGASTVIDSSANNYVLALTNFSDPTYTSMWTANGKFTNGLIFNAGGSTSNYAFIQDVSGLDFSSSKALTLAAWVNLGVPGSAQSNGACILCKGVTGYEQYCLQISGGVFQLLTRNSSGKSSQVVNSTISPVANTWYHVAAVWSASPQQQYIYINGQYNNTYSGSGFLTSQLTTNHPFTMGCKESSLTSGYNVPFQGTIDEVHVYDRVLTPGDIYQLYTNGATAANGPNITTQPRSVSCYLGDSPAFAVGLNASTSLFPVGYQWQFDGAKIAGATTSSLIVSNAQSTNAGTYTVVLTNAFGTNTSSNAVLSLQSLPTANTTSGLVGYWKYDDGSGSSTAADSSGYGDTGTLSGFTDTSYTSMWTNGVIGGALAFNSDGTGSNVVAVPNVGTPAPAILDFSSGLAFTLSAWVNGAATQTNGAGIIAKGTGNGGEQYTVDIFGGAYRFYVRDTNQNIYTAQTAVSPNGQWQQVVAVLNATNGIMNCYVNGQLAAQAVAPFSLQTNSNELSMGNRQPGTGSYGNALTGILDDVRVYNRDLTSADVSALYAAKPSPLSVTWASTNLDVVQGSYAQLAPALAGGIPLYTYQWQINGTNITGATSFPLILSNVPASAAGSYDLILANSNIVPSITSAVAVVTVAPYLTFNSNGVTWSAQGALGSSIWQGSNVAQLTPLGSGQSNSIFYEFPLKIGQFQASFTYQVAKIPTGSTGPGDGLTFCIQNDPRGASALAYNGNGLGVGDIPNITTSLAITPSLEFEFNINSANTSAIGVSWDANGALGPIISTAPLAIDKGSAGPGDFINASVIYQSGVATITLTDTNANAEFSLSTNVDMVSLLGSPYGYIGFTASTGSGYAEQQISDFTFQSLVNVAPTITQAPQSITNLPADEAAVFSVTAFGSVPFSYQWQLNGTNLSNGPSFTQSGASISGATTATLTVANAQTADAGTYTVLVANGNPPNTSASATLTVTDAPEIQSQSQPALEIFAGSSPTLFMDVSGLPPFYYQWTSNGTVIAGATGSAYTVISAGTTATYLGTVTNAYGSNYTSQITMTVLADPNAPYPLAVLGDHPMDFWRLDESSGSAGYDYVGGNNGLYTNVSLGGPGYSSRFNPNTDPNETAADFAGSTTNNSYLGWTPSQVNFGAAANSSQAFSIEAWITASQSPDNAGIVSLGYGGAEQFCLDLGATAANDLRFFVRNATGVEFSAASAITGDSGNWMHVVGVCDQPHGVVALYVDGQMAATNAVPAGTGILESAQTVTIGSRQSGPGTIFDEQFNGFINDVAVYGYALNSNQVMAHYLSAGIAPANLQIQQQSQNVDEGQTVTFTASTIGTPPLAYFWTDSGNNLISTNPVLVVSNLQPGFDSYNIQVTNLYGQASASPGVNVYGGPVSLVSDISPLVWEVPPSYPVTFSAGIYGSAPVSYQWYLNGSTPIAGATSSTYSFLAAAGTNTYTLWATNESGSGVTSSSAATVEVGATPPVIGFANQSAWTLNNGASFISSPLALELTDGGTSESRNSFYNLPQYIDGFLASFTYTPSGGTATRADGVAFALQSSSSGTGALGSAGGGLGYTGIEPSVAFEMDLYTGSPGGTGINWETNGLTASTSGAPNGGTGAVNINSLDPINVNLFYNYNSGELNIVLADNSTSAVFSTNYAVGRLDQTLGTNLAYVGFTGATGSDDAVQEISNFSFSYSSTPGLTVGRGAGGALTISWPSTISSSFVLQQSGSVAGPWSNSSASISVTGGQYQATITPSGAAQFYRLSLQ